MPTILAAGKKLLLRDWLASDADTYCRWLAQGEWRLYDAPWYGCKTSMTPEEESNTRVWF